jgi:(p)ppGpp synthase/HD superfamily hydrolase
MALTPHTSADERAAAMAERLTLACRRRDVAEAAIRRVVASYRTAIDARAGTVEASGRFALLHPGRNVLIALEDVGATAADLLCACALIDAERPHRMPPPALRRAVAGDAAAELLERVPLAAHCADDDALLETLLAAGRTAGIVAVVDRLDFVRHLHLEPDVDRHAAYARTADVYLPLAARCDAALHRRLRWWLDMFARRFLQRER